MSFCEHCQGQRFDRARVLRALREVQHELRRGQQSVECERALRAALQAVRTLELPHLEEEEEETSEGQVVH